MHREAWRPPSVTLDATAVSRRQRGAGCAWLAAEAPALDRAEQSRARTAPEYAERPSCMTSAQFASRAGSERPRSSATAWTETCALCVRLRPLPRSACSQPVGRGWRWTRLVAPGLRKGVEDTRRSLEVSPRIVDADHSSITCAPGVSRHVAKACLAGERSALRSTACPGKSSDAFQHSDGSWPAIPCTTLVRDFRRSAVEIRAPGRQA